MSSQFNGYFLYHKKIGNYSLEGATFVKIIEKPRMRIQSTFRHLSFIRFIRICALIRYITTSRKNVRSFSVAGHFKLSLKVIRFSQSIETVLFFNTFSAIHNYICNTWCDNFIPAMDLYKNVC